jgi:acetylornithine deacetylase/succinyl-diaminopimelate desuccinylase-like protein
MTDVIKILSDLISIPSINSMGNDGIDKKHYNEGKIAEYIFDFIRKIGLEPIVQDTSLKGRQNIGAMLFKGDKYKTIILQSHMDTVDINGLGNLLLPKIKDGRIYGRGACDAKGSLACMLMAMEICALDISLLKNNVIVMAVVDEEYGGQGSYALIGQEPTKSADFGIVGEPTDSVIVNGYKGVTRWAIETYGKSCHSSNPEEGENAIYRMASILSLIEEYQKELSIVQDDMLGCETVSVGLINGGTAVNIVPDYCKIIIDRRMTRKIDPYCAMDAMSKYLKEKGIDFEFKSLPLSPVNNPDVIDKNHPGVVMLKKVCRKIGISPSTKCVSFGSDAYRMNKGGIATILWGPGSIRHAHGEDEYVEITDLAKAVDFYCGVMKTEML